MDPPCKPNDHVNRMTFVGGLRGLLGLANEKCKDFEEGNKDYCNIFKDIDENLWNYFIKDVYNYNNDIIKGYLGGNFKPMEEIKYEEAVTMMIRALGYEKEMESMQYPIDYLNKAHEIGILDKIESEIAKSMNYSMVSQLFLNCLETELKSVPSYFENLINETIGPCTQHKIIVLIHLS